MDCSSHKKWKKLRTAAKFRGTFDKVLSMPALLRVLRTLRNLSFFHFFCQEQSNHFASHHPSYVSIHPAPELSADIRCHEENRAFLGESSSVRGTGDRETLPNKAKSLFHGRRYTAWKGWWDRGEQTPLCSTVPSGRTFANSHKTPIYPHTIFQII